MNSCAPHNAYIHWSDSRCTRYNEIWDLLLNATKPQFYFFVFILIMTKQYYHFSISERRAPHLAQLNSRKWFDLLTVSTIKIPMHIFIHSNAHLLFLYFDYRQWFNGIASCTSNCSLVIRTSNNWILDTWLQLRKYSNYLFYSKLTSIRKLGRNRRKHTHCPTLWMK